MRRLLPLAVLLILPLLGSDSPKEYDDAAMQMDEIQGTWRLVAVEIQWQTVLFIGSVYTLRQNFMSGDTRRRFGCFGGQRLPKNPKRRRAAALHISKVPTSRGTPGSDKANNTS